MEKFQYQFFKTGGDDYGVVASDGDGHNNNRDDDANMALAMAFTSEGCRENCNFVCRAESERSVDVRMFAKVPGCRALI